VSAKEPMMYEFRCGSPVCKTHFTASTEDEMMAAVATHVLDVHDIAKPTKSLVQFLKENTIRQVGSTAKAG
jgi:predicted small metal-binding protein